MPKINKTLFGFFLAFGVSAISFGVLYLLNQLLMDMFNIRRLFTDTLLMILSLGVSVFIFKYYDERKAHYTSRGIALFIILAAIYMVYRFFWPETWT